MAARRSPAAPLTSALTKSLASAATLPQDAAAVELAKRLAAEIDGGGDLSRLSSNYLAVLASLGMTPAARAAVKGGAPGASTSPAVDALAELRKRRAGSR